MCQISKRISNNLKTKRKKNSNSQNSGNLEMKNLPLQSNKSMRKKGREELNWPTTSRNKPRRRISQPNKISWKSNTQPLPTKLYKINKRRTSTHMLRNASGNGEHKARTWNHLSWNSKTTRREYSEMQVINIIFITCTL